MTGESPEESCAPVDFVVPGLDGFQFVAWGTRHGMVYVGYYSRTGSDASQIRTVLGLPLGDDGHECGAVKRVEYGGGPHALLAAATDTCLAVFRLDRLMYDLVSSQEWLGNGGDSMDVYRVCHVEREVSVYEPGVLGGVLGISWTHQLDGILVSDSESRVQMWRVHTRDHVSELSLFWEARSQGPQEHVSAGAWVASPCVTAGDRGVYVWWYKDCVTCETLKHPTKVVHVEWSPGTLRKDSLEDSSTVEGDGMEDHPAIMTLDEEGCVRIWVEMVVMHDETSLSSEESDRHVSKDGPARSMCRSDSYFAMTLMINVPCDSLSGRKKKLFCSWVKPLDSMLGYSHTGRSLQSHILWLIVGHHTDEHGLVTLSLHAVRGLAAVVVSNFSSGILASRGAHNTQKAPKKPQAVLWGSFVWDTGLQLDVSRCVGTARNATLSARMVYGDDFPEIHCLATICGDDSSSIMSSGICLGTCLKEMLPNSPASIQQKLYLSESWKGFGQTHTHSIVSVAMFNDHVVSLGADGCLILWGLGGTKDSLCYCCSIQLESKPLLESDVCMKAVSSGMHDPTLVLVVGTIAYKISISHTSLSVIGSHRVEDAKLYAGMCGNEFCIISMKENKTNISSSFHSKDVSLDFPNFMSIDKDDKIVMLEGIQSHHDGVTLLVGTSFGHIRVVHAKHSQQMFNIVETSRFQLPRTENETFYRMEYEKEHNLLAALDAGQRRIHFFSISDNEASPCGVFQIMNNETISSFIWMPDEVVPCMAIGCHDGQVLVCALDNLIFDSWQVVAKFKSIGKSAAVKLFYSQNHLMCASGSSISMFGTNSLGSDDSSVCLGRVLLKKAGPLPLYHPRMLRSFIISGNLEAFFSVLSSYFAWLEMLASEMEAFDSTSQHASEITSPKTSGGDEFMTALECGNVFSPFNAPSARRIISDNNAELSKYLEKLQNMFSQGEDPGANLPAKVVPTSHESGMLDMAAFGMGNPAGSSQSTIPPHESGMLDMAAFGMENPAASMQSTVPPHESGMLDMAAFGMGNPAGSSQSTIPPHESGMLDMAAFRNDNSAPETAQNRNGNDLKISQAEKFTVQQCKCHLDMISKLCDKMEILQSATESDGLDLSKKNAFGLEQEVYVKLQDALKASKKILTPIEQDIDKPCLIFLLSLAWSGEKRGTQENQQATDSSANINDYLYRSMGLKNAAGVSFDFKAAESRGAKEAVQCDLMSKLRTSPLISMESLVWMSLSSTSPSLILSSLHIFQDDTNTRGILKGQGSWENLRSAGVAFWVRDKEELAKLVEESARVTFRDTRDPDQVALLYAAIGKVSILQGLYRTCNKQKQAEFFSRDFGQERNQTAACKNAFVLLGQHRYSMAATFFILGGKIKDAVEICIHQMQDIQLAIMLYKTLGMHSVDILEMVDTFLASNDVSGIEFIKHWVTGNLVESIKSLSTLYHSSESVWLLPTLVQLVDLAPEAITSEDTAQDIKTSISNVCRTSADILSRSGMPWLSIQLDLACPCGTKQSEEHRKSLSNTCALALIDSPIDILPECSTEEVFHDRIHHFLSQLEELRSMGVDISCNTALHTIERIYKSIARHHRNTINSLDTPKSVDSLSLGRSLSMDSQVLHSGRSSHRKSLDEQRDLARMLKKSQTFKDLEDSPVQIIYPKGVEIFKVDGDVLNSICSCPLLAPDVCGRLVAVSTAKNGILEFATHPDVKTSNMDDGFDLHNQSPFHESPTLGNGSNNQGGMFSKFVSQIFDQASWITDPLEDSSTMIDGDVGLAAVSAISSRTVQTPVLADAKQTVSKMLASHPHRQLFLSGCKDSGRIKLWQYDGPRPLRLFTPVPYQDLKELKSNPDMFSFSSTFARTQSLTSKMSHWGKAVDICFSENGERFASIGEGGLVAVWRLSSGFNKHSDVDGATCSEWWHTCIQQHGRSITFVGGGSVVIAASGACNQGNISLWDTSEAKPACIGRLTHHKTPVNRIRTLPGGWLLVAGDDSGNLSVSDVRMLGSSDKKALLWSVKACKGKIQAIDTIPYDTTMLPQSRSSQRHHLSPDCAIVTGGDDGIIRIWDPSNGSLFQQSQQVYHPTKTRIFGETKYSITDVTVCDEGIMSTGTDGIVRLFPTL